MRYTHVSVVHHISCTKLKLINRRPHTNTRRFHAIGKEPKRNYTTINLYQSKTIFFNNLRHYGVISQSRLYYNLLFFHFTSMILTRKRISKTKYFFFRRVLKIPKSDYQLHHVGCPQGTTRFPMDGFSSNLIFELFSKIHRKFSSSIKI